MAFDGIVTAAMVRELQDEIVLGKIDRVYQPEADELILHIHTKNGNKKLYATVESSSASVRLIDWNPSNPPEPRPFCMLLRKHLQGARIVSVEQKDSDRIIEMTVESLNELGFSVSKKLVFEIMGRHSNIILVNLENGKIIDSIKRISIDVDRVRQLLPGLTYQYPPAQDKTPFFEIGRSEIDGCGETWKQILSKVGGISPAFARELLLKKTGYGFTGGAPEEEEGGLDRYDFLHGVLRAIRERTFLPTVWQTESGPKEFYICPLTEYQESCEAITFSTLSEAMEYYFSNRLQSNRLTQKSHNLRRSVQTKLDKYLLKKQRLNEDLLRAENSDHLRLCGELLTANIYQVKQGMREITVTNYYDGKPFVIRLDPRWSPNRNAQNYFKRYGKAKTAIHEKKAQIEENQRNIDYLESVLTNLDNAASTKDIEDIRAELEETGFIRRRKRTGRRPKRYRADPIQFETSTGLPILVGRNNRENDELTTRMADKTDWWFHTKDIPGSHVIVRSGGRELTETEVFEAAGIAAYHSKGRDSENVPVDYTTIRHVHKPNGAKPGMVIFTDNRTVYVNPKVPETRAKQK